MKAAPTMAVLFLIVAATLTAFVRAEEDVNCIKCPKSMIQDKDIVQSGLRKKRSFGDTSFDFSMSMGDVIDDIHSFSMGFRDEFDPFNGVFPDMTRFGPSKQWWQGPNVCIREETKTISTNPSEFSTVVENAGVRILGDFATSSSSLHFKTSYCISSASAYKCNVEVGNSTSKTVTSEIHECCQGYARVDGDKNPGCNKALDLKTLDETIEKLGLNKLKDALSSVGLDDVIKSQNVTIFAPTDDAFDQYEDEERGKLAVYNMVEPSDFTSGLLVGGTPLGSESGPLILDDSVVGEVENIETTIMGHLVPGFLKSSSLTDDQLVETASGQTKLRINLYEHKGLPKKLVTANCAPVVSLDNHATNGVVHVVDQVIKTPKGSLMELIASDPQFSILKSLVGRSGLTSLLREEGSLTIFAPTNAAFEKMPDQGKLLSQILRKDRTEDDSCLGRILENHIVPTVICSAAIAGDKSVVMINKGKSRLNATRVDSKIFVGPLRAQVTRQDVLASNGILHAVDAVIIPKNALDVLQVARSSEGSKFASLVDKLAGKQGLKERLETTKNLTVFVPTDKAFGRIDPRILNVEDEAELEALLKHHVVPDSSIKSVQHLSPDEPLRTWDLKNPLNVQELNLWPNGRVKTVQCAAIVHKTIEGCNGNIILVDRVLVRPPGNVVDLLALDKNASTFLGLLKSAGLADMLQEKGPFTVFAPNDEAFESMRDGELEKLKEDPDMLKAFLKHHIAEGSTCASLVKQSSLIGGGSLRIPSLTSKGSRGDHLRFHSFQGIHYFVNHAQILQFDAVANNGVVHIINDVLKPREISRRQSRPHPMDSFFRRVFDGFHGGRFQRNHADDFFHGLGRRRPRFEFALP